MMARRPARRRLVRMVVNCRLSSAFLPCAQFSAVRLCDAPARMDAADGCSAQSRFGIVSYGWLRRDRHLRRSGRVASTDCPRLTKVGVTCWSSVGMRFAFASFANCWRGRTRSRTAVQRRQPGRTTKNAEYETTHCDARGRWRRDHARLLSRHRLSALCRCARHLPRASSAAFLVRDFVRVARRAT